MVIFFVIVFRWAEYEDPNTEPAKQLKYFADHQL